MNDSAKGPAAMASASIGMVWLYDAAADDVRAYAALDSLGALGRVRWLLPRVGSLANGGPLGDEAAAALSDAEVERLAEQYVDTPANQRRAEALGPTPALRRGTGESAVAYLDRVLRSSVAAEEKPREPVAPVAHPTANARVLSLGIAALVMGVVLCGLAALFSYRAYEREGALQADVERVRLEMRALLARQAEDGRAKLVTLEQQNRDMRARLERLEARPTRSPDRTPDRATPASKGAKPRTQTRR